MCQTTNENNKNRNKKLVEDFDLNTEQHASKQHIHNRESIVRTEIKNHLK